MDVAEFLAASAHVVAGAIWLGAMAYSLTVVQPRARRFLEEKRRHEQFVATVAAGARYPVLVAISTIAVSGAVLVAIADDRPAAWWALVALKAVALAAALAVFCVVSWRLWPRRLFASDAELPAIRRRFQAAAVILLALVGAGTILGVAASATA